MKQLLLMFILLVSSFINAQDIFDFGCVLTAQELEAERIGLLNALDDTKAYARVEGGYFDTNYYMVRVIGTSLDGIESDYYGNTDDSGNVVLGGGISYTYLTNLDGSVTNGWDVFYAGVQQAVTNAENATLAELRVITNARTLELEAESKFVQVVPSWDSTKGHIIKFDVDGEFHQVDGVDYELLSSDYGHRNYGKITENQFKRLVSRVGEVVRVADPNWERTLILLQIQEFATGDTTITHSVVEQSAGFTDRFTTSFDGAGENGSEPWSRILTTANYVELFERTGSFDNLQLQVLDEIKSDVIKAQAEYDLRN